MKKVDFIIVGQGLAGSLLSHVLLKNGKSIQVFDYSHDHSSSRVAAGLYNPITGRKMLKTWNADKIFPAIAPTYKELELRFGKKFLFPVGIYRPFRSYAEQNEWHSKYTNPFFAPYIKEICLGTRYDSIHDSLGGIILKTSGYVDIPLLLDSMADHLKKLDSLCLEKFQVDEMKISKNMVEYRGIVGRKIVFCTGVNLNRLFAFLPIRAVKGEILEIVGNFGFSSVVNRGVFVLPKNDGSYRVGSTYNWKDLSAKVSEEGRKQIVNRLETLVKVKYEVTGAKAAIRPTTPDRRPFIGLHPQIPEVGIFNGLGAKGVSLAPYYANQLYRMMEYGENLDSEVNINRYF